MFVSDGEAGGVSGDRAAERGGGDAPVHPGLIQLLRYWQSLRGGGARIDPRHIDRALEFAFIAEPMAPGVARFRLAGMHLNDLLGMDLRGMPLSCLFQPASRGLLSDTILHVFSNSSASEFMLTGDRGLGRPPLSGQMLLLPLRDDSGATTRLLGGIATRGEIGRPPRRFRLIGEGEAVEPPAPARGRPGLRLVHSRD